MDQSFEISARFLESLARALDQAGRLEEVIAVDEQLDHALRNPHANDWWPGPQMLAVTSAIEQVGGAALIRQITKAGIALNMAPVVQPFIGLVLALSGVSPRGLLERLGRLSSPAVRGVRFQVVSAATDRVHLTITYPLTVPPCLAAYWEGLFDYLFEVTRVTGQSAVQIDGGVLRCEVWWW